MVSEGCGCGERIGGRSKGLHKSMHGQYSSAGGPRGAGEARTGAERRAGEKRRGRDGRIWGLRERDQKKPTHLFGGSLNQPEG
jgi:hypothetical protein